MTNSSKSDAASMLRWSSARKISRASAKARRAASVAQMRRRRRPGRRRRRRASRSSPSGADSRSARQARVPARSGRSLPARVSVRRGRSAHPVGRWSCRGLSGERGLLGQARRASRCPLPRRRSPAESRRWCSGAFPGRSVRRPPAPDHPPPAPRAPLAPTRQSRRWDPRTGATVPGESAATHARSKRFVILQERQRRLEALHRGTPGVSPLGPLARARQPDGGARITRLAEVVGNRVWVWRRSPSATSASPI